MRPRQASLCPNPAGLGGVYRLVFWPSEKAVVFGRCLAAAVFCLSSAVASPVLASAPNASWPQAVLIRQAQLGSPAGPTETKKAAAAALWAELEREHPVECDWVFQDAGQDPAGWLAETNQARQARGWVSRALEEIGGRGEGFRVEFEKLSSNGDAPLVSWLELYARVCEERRSARLQTVFRSAPRIVFTKHPTIRPSFFAYTEGQSDAQAERHFHPGASLCLLEMTGTRGEVSVLLEDRTGAIRDPAVSPDGQRVAFAWKKALNEDDYHLYEMEAASRRLRQITSGAGFADYEPAYLPGGDLIFASTRCVQTVDCWWTEVSNLYTCDKDGRHLRRLGFDQVHAIFPAALDDGRVIYTRWDYNDRGQIFPQALFQMNADGTGQTEFYGNNSWFPTTIAHARGIPGTEKVAAILCGHHSSQAGKLAVIDPARGRQENQGVQLVAPLRETRAERIDSYGQAGELFQYPYPLGETEFLVTYAPLGWEGGGPSRRRAGDAAFGIYWMAADGRRELLAADPKVACQQPVPLAARRAMPVRPSAVDYRKKTGTYYVQDIHAGPGLAGVPRGTVKKLRVIALEFRPAGVGNNGSSGPGGGALISTPIAVGNGSWDVKIVLGDAAVHEDGSAFFQVPARTPVYFQALDAKGRAVQTMRSWSTLQPGEIQSCVGCHEHKNTAPAASGYSTLALRAGPAALEPFYGLPRGFSFPREIQPILDKHCVSCHSDPGQRMSRERLKGGWTRERDPDWQAALRATAGRLASQAGSAPSAAPAVATNRPAFSLRGHGVLDRLAKRHWSEAYLNLTLAEPAQNDWDRGSFGGTADGRLVNWPGAQSIPAPLPPCSAGACRSDLLALLEGGHGGVRLSREELDKIACWIDLYVPYCGDYEEAAAWTPEETAKYRRYLEKRRRMEALEQRNIEELLASQEQAMPARVP